MTNPFLNTFYREGNNAFPTEIFFLLDRYKRFKKVNDPEILLADHFFLKTQIFAKHNLPQQEYKLFSKYFQEFNNGLRQPDLLIYLYADNYRLIKNITKRDRKMELNITDTLFKYNS